MKKKENISYGMVLMGIILTIISITISILIQNGILSSKNQIFDVALFLGIGFFLAYLTLRLIFERNKKGGKNEK